MVEHPAARSSSPISSPSNYSSAQGLTLIALKVKAAQVADPKHDSQTGAGDQFRNHKSSFHKRNISSANLLSEDSFPGQAHRKLIAPSNRNASKMDMARPSTQTAPHRRNQVGSVLSPGFYPKTPATPGSQLGSVVQVSKSLLVL